jgi:hypothetical protein
MGQANASRAELKTKPARAREAAARDFELDAAAACADVTPAGTMLATAIDKLDRTCFSAIRRLKARQRPQRPGPQPDPQTPVTTEEDLDDLAEPDQAEPADIAVDFEDAFASGVEVPTDDQFEPVAATTTEAGEPEFGDEPNPAAPDVATEICEVEANSVLDRAGPADVVDEAQEQAYMNFPESEQTLAAHDDEPAPIAAPTTEANELAAEAGLQQKCEFEANCVYGIETPDFERFGPEADRLRRLDHHLEATDGTGGPGPDSERSLRDSRMASAMEEHAIRAAELSRRIDAHFGINGERPDSS